jgi:hypothetical protein
MANPKGLRKHRTFRIVCINCDALGIVFDCPECARQQTKDRPTAVSVFVEKLLTFLLSPDEGAIVGPVEWE